MGLFVIIELIRDQLNFKLSIFDSSKISQTNSQHVTPVSMGLSVLPSHIFLPLCRMLGKYCFLSFISFVLRHITAINSEYVCAHT